MLVMRFLHVALVLAAPACAASHGPAPENPYALLLGSAPEIHTTVLLKMRASGGLFDGLAYCVERAAFTRLDPAARVVSIVVEDAPGGDWAFPSIRVEPPPQSAPACRGACDDGVIFDERIEPSGE